MSTKRTGLGRGIGALIPTSDAENRPVDVFFPGARRLEAVDALPAEEETAEEQRIIEEVKVRPSPPKAGTAGLSSTTDAASEDHDG